MFQPVEVRAVITRHYCLGIPTHLWSHTSFARPHVPPLHHPLQVWCEMAKGDLLAFNGGQPFSSPGDFRRHLRTKSVDISVCPDA